MINLSYVQEQIEMNKREELLKKHTYEIWLGTDGNWHTYLPDKQKGRIPKKRKSLKNLEDVIIEYWKGEGNNPTVEEVFYDWINEKLEYNEISKATYDRYVVDFKRYFLNSNQFGKKYIKSISEDEIVHFVKGTIAAEKLTAKAYGNFRILVYGIFKKCKKEIGFSITSLLSDINISRNSFTKVIKEAEYEVFSESEYPVIIKYLMENLDMINLGILLLFVTGLRIGEMCTLKKSDITDNYIKVRRTETVYKDNEGTFVYGVKEYPKTTAGVRDVILPSSYSWIIDRLKNLNSQSEYIFVKKGEHVKALFFRKRMESVCKKVGIVPKSPHKTRKTYGSILLDNNIDQRFILEQMGHVNISVTENNYHRNRKSMERKIEMLDKIEDLCIM